MKTNFHLNMYFYIYRGAFSIRFFIYFFRLAFSSSSRTSFPNLNFIMFELEPTIYYTAPICYIA